MVAFALGVLLVAVTPTSSATAEERTIEQRLIDQFFVDDELSSASLGEPAIFPACNPAFAKGEVEPNPNPELEPVPVANYRSCAGEVKTFDGLELDARVTFPPKLSGPLPVVLLLHGWGGNRNWMNGTHWSHPGNDPANMLAAARFWQKGYATLTYTARGFYASCGALDPAADVHAAGGTDVPSVDGCHPQGHTHIAERDFEVADSQRLLGLLVDAGVADPQRLAVAGASYGGGQSWLLATSMPWATPAGTPIQLAAAAPLHGWTDLYGSLVPNGRATDAVDQSASHEQPYGVVKQRYLATTYHNGKAAVAADPLALLGGGKYNSTHPEELHSYFDGWMSELNAGEPHATPQAQALPAAFRGKSAYHPVTQRSDGTGQQDYLTELAARRVRPVPILAVQGWTDFAFPAIEALQMYRKLKAAHPGYPIRLLLGDVGHGAQEPVHQVTYQWDQVASFIDTHLGVSPGGLPPTVASFPTVCGKSDPPDADAPEAQTPLPLTGDSWDTIVKPSPLTYTPTPLDRKRTTSSSSSDIEEELASDPQSVTRTCIERPADKSASGAFWQFPVTSDVTTLGLPTVTLPYTMAGQDATIVVKLWDVGPNEPDTTRTKHLVTRGVYRLSPPPGQTVSSGVISFKLFGNHWDLKRGHTVELEVGQRDAPFLRADNFPSTITYDGVTLSLPQAKG